MMKERSIPERPANARQTARCKNTGSATRLQELKAPNARYEPHDNKEKKTSAKIPHKALTLDLSVSPTYRRTMLQ